MSDFLRTVLTMSVMGAVAIPATLLFQALFGKWLSPKARLYMWIPVLLRLFVPYIPKTPVSIYNLLPDETLTAIELPLILNTAMPAQIRLLPLIWFLGAILFAAFSFASYLRFVNRLEFVQKDMQATEHIANEAATLTELKKQPETVFCRNRISPMVVGLFSPKLVLPIHILEQFDEDRLRIIFVHEYTHLARRDGLLNWLLLLAGCLHWFNPLVHLMRKAIRRDSEQVCDACVLHRLPPDARTLYSRTILDLLECTVSIGRTAITAPMAGTKRTLAARLKSIYRIGKRKISIIALPLCLMISVTLLTGALAKDISETVGTVSELLDPVLVIPTPEPTPEPTATAPSPTPSSDATPSPATEETPSAPPTEEAPSENVVQPATEPQAASSAPTKAPSFAQTATPSATPAPAKTPTPAPTETPVPSSPVYIYQGGGAVARLSKDRARAGFSAQLGDIEITTVGIRTTTESSLTGFFTVTVNGEIIADHAPGVVRGSVSGISFSTSDGVIRYTFPLSSRIIE